MLNKRFIAKSLRNIIIGGGMAGLFIGVAYPFGLLVYCLINDYYGCLRVLYICMLIILWVAVFVQGLFSLNDWINNNIK